MHGMQSKKLRVWYLKQDVKNAIMYMNFGAVLFVIPVPLSNLRSEKDVFDDQDRSVKGPDRVVAHISEILKKNSRRRKREKIDKDRKFFGKGKGV